MKNRFTMGGAAALIAALALFGASMTPAARSADAAVSTPQSTASVSPQATPCGGVVLSSLNSVQAVPCTPVTTNVSTATPTSSPTSAATNTAVAVATTAPATVAPVNTTVPATATSPSGGQLGAVSAPNTGTGDGTAAGGFPWLVLAGMALAIGGLGSLGYGVRKRR